MPSVKMGGIKARKHGRNRWLLLIALGLSVLLWNLDQDRYASKFYQHAIALWSAPAELAALRADLEKLQGAR